MHNDLTKALNKQLNLEFASSHLYLSMSSYLESANMSGCAHWTYQQYKEETEHTMKFFHYLITRGCRVMLSAIPEPKQNWNSLVHVFDDIYANEKATTEGINGLMDIAISVKDYATQQFLQWYFAEQVEEEASVLKIIDKIKMVKDNAAGLLFIDKELGTRAAK